MKIQQIKLSEDWKTAKNGKKYLSCGIKVDGQWYNNLLWDEAQVAKVKQWQDEAPIKLTESPKEGGGTWYNWKFRTRIDDLEERIEKLEKRMDDAAKLIRDLR